MLLILPCKGDCTPDIISSMAIATSPVDMRAAFDALSNEKPMSLSSCTQAPSLNLHTGAAFMLMCAMRVNTVSHVILALHAWGSHKVKLIIPMASAVLKIARDQVTTRSGSVHRRMHRRRCERTGPHKTKRSPQEGGAIWTHVWIASRTPGENERGAGTVAALKAGAGALLSPLQIT